MIGYGLGALGAAVLLWGLDRVSELFIRPVPRPPDLTVGDVGVRHEDLAIPAGPPDGHALRAWRLIPEGTPRDPVFLLAHGWGASYGTLLRLGGPLVRAGYEVLLFDMRGHGRNEEVPYVTVRHFRDDVSNAVRYARERFPGRPLVLVGHSLGGAASVLAVAEGAKIDALVLIAAPADVMQITAEYLSDEKGLPGRLIVRFFRPFWWRRVGGSFLRLTPARRIAEIRAPLLMLHPAEDRRVSRAHADRLARAAGQSYVLIDGAEHTDVLEHPETLRRIRDFVSGLEGVRAPRTPSV